MMEESFRLNSALEVKLEIEGLGFFQNLVFILTLEIINLLINTLSQTKSFILNN